MLRKWLAIGIILLFVGVTIAPTINFNTVKASQQNIIKERINQRELLFQTIVDIANNMEIQRVILKPQISRGIFPISEIPVVTKNQLKRMYLLGVLLSRFIGTSRIQLMIQKYLLIKPEMQKEISTIIEKNPTLNNEIVQLQNSECDCGNYIDEEKILKIEITDYQKICGLLFIIWIISAIIIIPFEAIFEFLRNMEFILLAKLYSLITLPIWFPFLVIFTISLFLFIIVFSCISGYPVSFIKR